MCSGASAAVAEDDPVFGFRARRAERWISRCRLELGQWVVMPTV